MENRFYIQRAFFLFVLCFHSPDYFLNFIICFMGVCIKWIKAYPKKASFLWICFL